MTELEKRQQEYVAWMDERNADNKKIMGASLVLLAAYPVCVAFYVYAEEWRAAVAFGASTLFLAWVDYRQWKRIKRAEQIYALTRQAFKSFNPNFLIMATDQIRAYVEQLKGE
jgi:hypothetical protein